MHCSYSDLVCSLILPLGLYPTVKMEIQIFTEKSKGPCMTSEPSRIFSNAGQIRTERDYVIIILSHYFIPLLQEIVMSDLTSWEGNFVHDA